MRRTEALSLGDGPALRLAPASFPQSRGPERTGSGEPCGSGRLCGGEVWTGRCSAVFSPIWRVPLIEVRELLSRGGLSRNGVGHLQWKGVRLGLTGAGCSRNAGGISRGGAGARKRLPCWSVGTSSWEAACPHNSWELEQVLEGGLLSLWGLPAGCLQ